LLTKTSRLTVHSAGSIQPSCEGGTLIFMFRAPHSPSRVSPRDHETFNWYARVWILKFLSHRNDFSIFGFGALVNPAGCSNIGGD
jgi:hypothetical protein